MKITQSTFSNVTKMKNFLIEKNKKSFSTKDFIKETGLTAYALKQIVNTSLIINTGETYANRPGAPKKYKLHPIVHTTHVQQKYTLTEEDIDLLLQDKETKLKTLNKTIENMQNKKTTLKNEYNNLKGLK